MCCIKVIQGLCKIQMRKRLLVEEAWNRGIAALLAFIEREGHCAVPRSHKERGYRLGQWVAVQRYSQANLDWLAESATQSDRVLYGANATSGGMRDLRLSRRSKPAKVIVTCRANHVEGKVHLGHWVTVQRRERDKMKPHRKQRLDKIGFVWKGQRQSNAR